MQYQYRTMRGSGSSPRTGVKASLKNAIIAVLCIIALIVVAFIFPTSAAKADNPDTSTPSPSVFPVMPPSYCGDGTVTVLSSTGSVYLVGVGKNDIARDGENDAGPDGTKEVGAKCMIPGPLLPGVRTTTGNSRYPNASAPAHGRLATYDALGSGKDGTLWAVLNQGNAPTDPSINKSDFSIAIYRIKPGETEWTQMGGAIGTSGSPYWGYKQSDLKNIGYVVGGGVNPVNDRYYFISMSSTQRTVAGKPYTTRTLHLWVTPKNCSQTSCLPREVGTVSLGEDQDSRNNHNTGGDLTFTDNGDLILAASYAGGLLKGTPYQIVTSRTGIIPARALAQGGALTLQNAVTSTTQVHPTEGFEPGPVTGIGRSYTSQGSTYPVISRLTGEASAMNNLYDFSGYQLSPDNVSQSFYDSRVFAFPAGPAYVSSTDPDNMKIGRVINPDGIWTGKYSPTTIPTFWDQHFTDVADGAYVSPTGSLTINKVDKDDNSQKLSKARFAVWRQAEASCDVDIKNLPADAKTTGPTGTDGQVKVNDLAYGTYCVKETTAPDNHKLNDKAQVANISAATPNVILTFEDELVSTITVKKIDESSHDALEGATFVLYVDANNDGKVDSGDTKYPNNDSATKKTDSNGLAEWTDIPVGHYILQETKAPEGYVTPSGEQANHPVEVTKDNAKKGVTLTITNFTFTAQLPLTGGTSTDVFVISSVALIVIAGGLYGLYMVYRRRQSLH
jgi:hypothetical protein